MTKQIEVSDELYNAMQSLKMVFSQLSGEEISWDEEVIWILVSGFVESLKNENDLIDKAAWHECDCESDCGDDCKHK